MIRFGPALVVMLGAAHASLAEGFPALYDVTGVAAGDVLNIRAAASASAPLVGALHRQATGVEVVAVEGAWAVVAAGEASGYAALRYLVRQPVADWYTLHGPITCHGTEPFWTLRLDPAGAAVAFSTPEAGFESDVLALWPGQPHRPVVAAGFDEGFATLRPAACSDGMSDRRFGLAIDLFLTATPSVAYAGCCSILP